MTTLSLTQDYVLYSLTERGKIPSMNAAAQVCILAAGLLELLDAGCIRMDEKKQIHVASELKPEFSYLESLYLWLKDSKPMTVEKIAEEYSFTLNGKKLRVLTNAVGDSLVTLGCAAFEQGGFGKKHYYIPDLDSVDDILDKIRMQILEKKNPDRHTYMLVYLLEKSRQIKRYFSIDDKNQIKIKRREIKKTFTGKLQEQMLFYGDIVVSAVMAVTEPEK